MEKGNFNGIENKELPKYGANIELRNLWVRHSQKSSGEVFSQEGDGISNSSISQGGHDRARVYGENLGNKKKVVKSYISKVDRTAETGHDIIDGYVEKNNMETVALNERYCSELNSAPGNPEWLALFNEKFTKNKNQLLSAKGLSPEQFSSLSPDEQELIAETAEEPVMREWLDDPDSDLANAYDKNEAAALFAPLFDDHTFRIVDKLKSESKLDLLHNTHKTATEAFLTSGVLKDKSGKKVNTLAELGGSLQILGNWESIVKTNESKEKEVVVRLKGEEFSVDTYKLQELLDWHK